MENYFVKNLETKKLELHFTKEKYLNLTDEQKRNIKAAFLWGRNSGCWISRRQEPHLYYPREVALSLGLEDAGETGERLTFAEQMARKAEKAERRAERYERHADAAAERGNTLQRPILEKSGDTAFFTQPNANTSAGRSFTNRREKMFAAFDRGLNEFRKSEYWKDRARTARATAKQNGLKDKSFVDRRIRERESEIRKIKKAIETWESWAEQIKNGEKPCSKYGCIDYTLEQINEYIDQRLDALEIKLDELAFYQECLDNLGGIQFSRDNVKPGYQVRIPFYGVVTILSAGPKNFRAKECGWPMQYASILEVVSESAPNPAE